MERSRHAAAAQARDDKENPSKKRPRLSKLTVARLFKEYLLKPGKRSKKRREQVLARWDN